MYQPVIDLKPTPEQHDVELAVVNLLRLDPHSVQEGSLEAMALGDGKVRVHWTGMATVSREDFLAVVPNAVIV